MRIRPLKFPELDFSACWLACVLACLNVPLLAAGPPPLAVDEVPAPLAPWRAWVLDGETDPGCPWIAVSGTRECAWPGLLTLEVGDDGAGFTLEAETWGETLLPLPGRETQWPQDVLSNDVRTAVIAQDGLPMIRLPAGRHRIEGRFTWREPPENLRIPPAYGLLALLRDGVRVNVPQRTPAGDLWLRAPAVASAEAERDALRLQVYRRVSDELPLQVETLLEFDVSGTQREVSFAGALPAAALPMRLDSALPARVDGDGRLRVQVRPGHWQLRLHTRQPGPVDELARPAGGAHWPAEELWVFDARPALRIVEVAGGTPVDPRQTTLPEDWRALPAFRLGAGDAMRFTVQRRGDPEPAPDRLQLVRDLWLDFDGGGYTVRDTIGGQFTRGWRLDAGDALRPGRVLLDGEAQFITEYDGRHGVEVRRGTLDLRADSRIDSRQALNAVGWAQDFDAVSATLHLPPGWRLWSARGVDRVSDTWLLHWTLLDLFLVFIVALAIARLWSWPLGAVALVTLVLCWHERDAPQLLWLQVLAAVALVRVLPTGRLRMLVAGWRNLALLALLVMSVNFAIVHLRVGLFPQLAQPWRVDTVSAMAAEAPQAPEAGLLASEALAGAADMARDELTSRVQRMKSAPVPAPASTPRYDVQREYDPQATIQTGPGLPGWQWRAAELQWSGPVTAAQTLDLVLLSPRVNLLLALLRVVLLGVLVALILRAVLTGPGGLRRRAATTLLFALSLVAGNAHAAQTLENPDPVLLDALKTRLLRAPDCVPDCASLPRLAVSLAGHRLRLRLEVHVARTVALPLPGRAEQWLPEQVLVNGVPVAALRRDAQGGLMIVLGPGIHEVVLDGRAPQRTNFQLSLPLVAQQVQVVADGWAVDGIERDGGRAAQLMFTRQQAVDPTQSTDDQASALPPFFSLERRLELGLDWRVHYRLQRLTPPGVGASLSIPLLQGEAVTTEALMVVDDSVRIEFGVGETVREWTSVLARHERIELRAADTLAWVETWRADVSPVWHIDIAGIPVVHDQADGGRRLPTWRPWPGETVSITLSRPAGVPGRTLTIDRSELRLAPGQRATDATLDFRLRSSQGGRHAIDLPADAVLQSVAIDGATQPIRQEGRQVILPVVPGEQQVNVQWRSEASLATRLATPSFSLGIDSVNTTLSLVLPPDRWVLFAGGPTLGPAVLFWGTLIVVCVLAFALGRLRLAPVPAWQWLLLGIGLTQTSLGGATIVVGCLLALGLRARLPATIPRWQFNLVQIALAGLTLAALLVLFDAIRQGLLGAPAMQIAGNGSTAEELRWFVDRAGTDYPQAWVWSVSIWCYRLLMLAWALWLAFALLDWLRWGWQHYSRDGIWRRLTLFRRKPVADEVASD